MQCDRTGRLNVLRPAGGAQGAQIKGASPPSRSSSRPAHDAKSCRSTPERSQYWSLPSSNKRHSFGLVLMRQGPHETHDKRENAAGDKRGQGSQRQFVYERRIDDRDPSAVDHRGNCRIHGVAGQPADQPGRNAGPWSETVLMQCGACGDTATMPAIIWTTKTTIADDMIAPPTELTHPAPWPFAL